MSGLCVGVLLETHAEILDLLRGLARRSAASGTIGRSAPPILLDVGCWDGSTTVRFAEAIGARAMGVEVAGVDLETQALPWSEE